MGSAAGKLQRYKAPEEKQKEKEPDHNAWRQPKQRGAGTKDSLASGATKENLGTPAATKSSSSSARPSATPTPASANAIRLGGGETKGSIKTGLKPTRAPTLDEDDDMQDEGFSNLAKEADKVWEQLMSQKQKPKSTDFSSLFSLGELKDEIEKAAKRSDQLNRTAAIALAKVQTCRNELNDLSVKIESRSDKHSGKSNTNWRLGDVSIRRGKGACEIAMVHHEENPPFFEVRMFATGSLVGTEANNLVALTGPQQAQLREALRNLEDSERKNKLAQEAAAAANDELQQQHQFLSTQVEKMLSKDGGGPSSNDPVLGVSGNSMPSPGLSEPFDPSKPPPGMPDLNRVKRWTGAQESATRDSSNQESSESAYPSVSGVKEVIGSAPTQTGPGPGPVLQEPSTTEGFRAAETEQTRESAPNSESPPRSHAPPGVPMGFPSLDKLKTESAPAPAPKESYPSAHVSRETFTRPEPERSNTASTASTSNPSKVEPEQRNYNSGIPAQNQAPPPTNTTPRESGVPMGMPGLPKKPPQSATFAAAAAQQQQQQEQQRREEQKRREQEQQRQQQQQQQQYQQQQQQQQQQYPETVWVAYHTAEGQVYYHCEATNETAWDLPPGGRLAGQPAQNGGVYNQWAQGGQTNDPYAAYRTQQQNAARTQQQNAAWTQQQNASGDDPWAHLRQQDAAQKEQRDAYAQWYQQYYQWYQQQQQYQQQQYQQQQQYYQQDQQQQGVPGGEPPNFGGAGARRASAGPQGGYGGAGGQQAPAKDVTPQPVHPVAPGADASFEEQAIYAMKVAVLKEMRVMVEEQKSDLAQRKKELRGLQIRWHPDKNPERGEIAKSVFQFIEENKNWFLQET